MAKSGLNAMTVAPRRRVRPEGARQLHPAGRHPDGHLRGVERGDQGQRRARRRWAGPATPRTSPAPPCSSPARRRRGSPARACASTAAPAASWGCDGRRARALRRVRHVRRQRRRVRPALRRPADRAAGVGRRRRRPPAERAGVGRRRRRSWCSSTAAPRTPTRGTPWRWPSAGRWWPSTCPATATPTAAATGRSTSPATPPTSPTLIRALAPDARAVVGMSLGGLTTLALAQHAPGAGARPSCSSTSRRACTAEKAKAITAFVNGPASFASFDDAAGPHDGAQPDAQRGVAAAGHPAQRRPARRRHVGVALRPLAPRGRADAEQRSAGTDHSALWDVVDGLTVPVLLVRGHAPAVGRRRRRRGRAAAPLPDGARSCTSRRPATACRATRPSSWRA